MLTYHLAWVPTVMPVDHPPIKAFSEKRTSQSVNMLAKTHPYNPLWAQLGDLYGAIGSPVRLTRTVVVGKQKDLVQRILYVLTYFLRCSELQENQLSWSGNHGEGEQVLNGSKITTALEKGEVEESEYVVVTVRSEPALLPPILPPSTPTAEGRGLKPEGLLGTPEGPDLIDLGPKPDKEGSRRPEQNSEACSLGFQEPALTSSWKCQGDTFCEEEESLKETSEYNCSRVSSCEALGVTVNGGQQTVTVSEESKGETPKTSPDQAVAWPCPDRFSRDQPSLEKVTFQIGSSVSPESDFESRTRKMEERLQACRQRPGLAGPSAVVSMVADPAHDQQASRCSITQGSQNSGLCPRTQSPEGDDGNSDRGFAEDRGIRTEAADVASGQACRLSLNDSAAGVGQRPPEDPRGLHLKAVEGQLMEPVPNRCVQQDFGLSVAAHVPCGDAHRKADFRVERDIPRNESSDSALGDSDDDACASTALHPGHSGDQAEEAEEVELPLPRSQSISSPSMRNFGRSLLAGYCPTYMPDLVLHGTSSDEKLKQCLLADLVHTVHHPVLDEPIAEAVCIIADTDKWSVQVATSQRKVMDSMKLGQDVLVSSQVSSLLQSLLQLYKLHLPADFCIMHLEDRLQEMYLKSKMLSEYLRGHTRVHVKELGVVLGIESNDLPLLTAVASTHSPYVAQILL